MRSTSRLRRSPAWRSPQVVTASVCGMMSTENTSPSTPFTVSEVPSRATEPFSAMKRGERPRRADVEARARSPRVIAAGDGIAGEDLRHAVDMARDDVPAELVADLERALEVEARARPPCADRGAGKRLRGGVDFEPAAVRAPADRDDGEARAGAGDRGAERDRRRDRRRLRCGCGAAAPASLTDATLPMSVTMPVNIRPSRRARAGRGRVPPFGPA